MRSPWILCAAAIALGASLYPGRCDARSGEGVPTAIAHNLERTQAIAQTIRAYMHEQGFVVALLSRRGKIVDHERGISDVDKYDATGMAHTGFLVRTGFGATSEYLTLNLVRVPLEGREVSQLRAWSLEQFFAGSVEKDAFVLVPEKSIQLALWNALLHDMTLEPTEVTIGGETATRHVVRGGLFERYHIHAYNLMSDYAFNQTQNCNEHLIKTLISVVHHKRSLDEVSLDLELRFEPYELRISGLKRWFARHFMNLRIKAGERVVGGKSRFRIITVESMVAAANRDYLGIETLQVFRETRSAAGYTIRDAGEDYVKRNSTTGKANKLHFEPPEGLGPPAEVDGERVPVSSASP